MCWRRGASWLVRSFPYGAVRVISLFSRARRLTLTLPPHPGVQMGNGEFNAGGNLSMD